MTRLRAIGTGLASGPRVIMGWIVAWARGTSDRERLMYIGLVMLGAGVGMVDIRLALALDGAILTAVAIRLPRQPSEQ